MQVPTLSLTPRVPSEREKLHQAAQAFEAIFIRQMLSSARAASFGEGVFSSQATQTFQQMQDERFADIASKTGALGLAKVLEAQLARQIPPLPPAGGAGGGAVIQPRPTSPPLTPPAGGRGTNGFISSSEGVR